MWNIGTQWNIAPTAHQGLYSNHHHPNGLTDMPHIHRLPDGEATGRDVPSPQEPNIHWHLVDNVRTSTDPYGPGHSHTIQGEQTGGPIGQSGASSG